MSNLIVEVCKIERIEKHPNADALDVCRIKGWQVISKKSQFNEGDLCVFFPPEAVLPPSLINKPEDDPPGRLGITAYVRPLAKVGDERPPGGRVVACRLRGVPSYGVIMAIDPAFGDDPNWTEGTDVAAHFGVTKYEPPPRSSDGEEDRPSNFFYEYTNIDRIGDYPDAFKDGEEVIFTEKIHGSNCRLGLVLEAAEDGEPTWTFMAGSNNLRRREFVDIKGRFRLIDIGREKIEPDEVFEYKDKLWKALPVDVNETEEGEENSDPKVLCVQVRRLTDGSLETVKARSTYWEPMTDSVKAMLQHVRDNLEWHENKHSIVCYGEIYGLGVQDMQYGMKCRGFRLFGIAVNNQYLDFDVQQALCSRFGIEMVPILYRGPFSQQVLQEYTSGPTTLCASTNAGKFKGREGIVVTPVKEVHFCPVMRGRRIAKSISVDYLARKDGTEFH